MNLPRGCAVIDGMFFPISTLLVASRSGSPTSLQAFSASGRDLLKHESTLADRDEGLVSTQLRCIIKRIMIRVLSLLHCDLADTARQRTMPAVPGAPMPNSISSRFMPRRSRVIAASLCLLIPLAAMAAGSLDAVSSKDAAGGMRAAISQGIDKAIAQLGAPNGFLNNPKYTIPLPSAMEKADRALRMIGMSGDADQLKVAMNHAAEMAVADAKPVFKQAAQKMTVSDAKGILTGGETSATEYFRKATTAQLTARFKPIVAKQTEKLKLRALYDQYAGKAAQVGLVKSEDANLNDYVTARALDGLFGEIADEERAIRKDPMGQASSLIKKVFSSL
jgi:hypothetical protein